MLLAPPPPILQIISGADLWLDEGAAGEIKRGQAVVLRGGRIVAVGPEGQLRKRFPKAAQVALPGGTLLPAFTEGHAHVGALGITRLEVQLGGAADLQAALNRIQTWSALHLEGWIQGRGWDQNRWPGKAFPTSRELDTASAGRPAMLKRVDGHAVWVNTAALRLAGISKDTPDPNGGRILRDEQGNPTGVLVDGAMELVSKLVPQPTEAERREHLMAGLRDLRDQGFSAVADMGIGAGDLAAYRSLDAAHALPIRVFAYLSHDSQLLLQELKQPRGTRTSFFQVQGVKFYLDGALGSRGARLLQPYADDPASTGLWVTDPAKIRQDVAITLKAGYQPAIHAIGDAANRAALDLLETTGKPTRPSLPARIEHAQIAAPADVARFGKLRVIASVQPVHCTSDHAWTPARLGPARVDAAFPWRGFLKGGATLAFGSDAPIEDPNPFIALAAAETREDPDGNPPGGFLPAQRLTREETLRAYVLGNAMALGRKDMGRLRPGGVADLLWVEVPILQLTPAELRKVRPGRLWVNGLEVPAPGRP